MDRIVSISLIWLSVAITFTDSMTLLSIRILSFVSSWALAAHVDQIQLWYCPGD